MTGHSIRGGPSWLQSRRSERGAYLRATPGPGSLRGRPAPAVPLGLAAIAHAGTWEPFARQQHRSLTGKACCRYRTTSRRRTGARLFSQYLSGACACPESGRRPAASTCGFRLNDPYRPDLRDALARITPLPAIERLLAHTHLANDLGNLGAGLRLLRGVGDLLLRAGSWDRPGERRRRTPSTAVTDQPPSEIDALELRPTSPAAGARHGPCCAAGP
jgi:hypothetical protein